jgi:hypothetical protein
MVDKKKSKRKNRLKIKQSNKNKNNINITINSNNRRSKPINKGILTSSKFAPFPMGGNLQPLIVHPNQDSTTKMMMQEIKNDVQNNHLGNYNILKNALNDIIDEKMNEKRINENMIEDEENNNSYQPLSRLSINPLYKEEDNEIQPELDPINIPFPPTIDLTQEQPKKVLIPKNKIQGLINVFERPISSFIDLVNDDKDKYSYQNKLKFEKKWATKEKTIHYNNEIKKYKGQ